MSSTELYLIDGSAYIYRAYHAIRPLSNSTGLPTHAVFGFITILGRLLKERDPQYLAVAFDTKGPVFRHQLYSDYKANRPPMPEDLAAQIPYIHRLTAAYRIPCLMQDDQEADDLIASLSLKMADLGCSVVIVSGDKDLLQLVSDRISLWDPMNDQIMDEQAVLDKYGVPPSELLDFFALTGDSSDNIPGVNGIGPKSAQKLISQYHTLEGIYQSINDMKPSKMRTQLEAEKEKAFLSRDLVRLNDKADVPADLSVYRRQDPDGQELRKLFAELEFHSMLKEEKPQGQAVETGNFHLLQDEAKLPALASRLKKEKILALDTETDSLDTTEANLVGLSLAIEDSTAWYLPCGHRDAEGHLLAGQLSLEALVRFAREVLAGAKTNSKTKAKNEKNTKNVKKIGHNLKFDLEVLAAPQNGGIEIQGPLYDTLLGAWLLDAGRSSYKLDDLCLEIDLHMTPFTEVVKGDRAADAFCRVDMLEAKNYSCEDVYAALQLYAQQVPRLEEAGLSRLMDEMEAPLIPVLADMEKCGIRVDKRVLADLSQEFGQRLDACEAEIYRSAGEEFNINSPKQLGEILFERLALPRGRKTKTGWSTDVKILEKLSHEHELPALILQYRNLAKLKSTYVDKLALLRKPDTSRVHTSFNQWGTATGRLSSSNPNLQNIPIRTEEGRRIRSAFVAEEGCQLISADYSQIDLRVLAHYSEDKALIEAFAEGEDIHRRTAAQVFCIAPEFVNSEMRRAAKAINFGIVYGMSGFGLASQLQIGRREAQTFIDRYLAYYSGVRRFMEDIVRKARTDGYVTTLLGRRRYLPDIDSKNRNLRDFAERAALNTPVQGTAADIIKLAMLAIHKELLARGLRSRMLLQIHDELVVEAPEAEVAEVSSLLKECMESAMQLKVPLLVNVSHAASLDKGD